ncbi:SPOR domain-containing protein [Stakelama marina]|uniref:SPOR domain-containing protein n=1 Tax=Stakelama marina TaxID=2826939 RepID=A0A8T4I823_9SPHN|nr:SPOR domain-containing protein [Stakelama marina]MBR0551138.1 SPOR domain-containing protein [Stakelama marina]
MSAPPVAAQEIVQPATPHADKLAAQMRILAKDPKNLDALIEAGRLSVRLGEPAAAFQFFQRAEDVSPDDPRITAGRAAAYVILERPGEALRLFAQAEQKGVPIADFAADRGLAYDLTGHPDYAQSDYRLALSKGDDPEVRRRLALSLAISGDRKQAADMLDPMLRKQDRGAWRAQAFNLAMNGDIAGADKIVRTILPDFSGNLTAFFRRLADASPAEKAFAVHFGQLSLSPAQIADAQLAPPLPLRGEQGGGVEVASAEPARKARKPRRQRRAKQEKTQPKAEQQQTIPVRLAEAEAEPVQKPVTSSAPLASTSEHVAATAMQPAMPPPATAPDTPPAAEQKVAKAPATEKTAPSSIGSEEDRIGAIMRGISVPASELGVAPMPGAEAPRPAFGATTAASERKEEAAPTPATEKPAAKPQPTAKPKKSTPDPAKQYPARHWVQVAGGANQKTLPREWNRLKDKAPEAFKGKQAWTTPLRFTNRLLAGPFDSEADAQDFVNKLAGKGLSAFTFTSDAGQKIEKLDIQ